MSDFIYYIYYRPGFKIGKPKGLSSCSEEVKSGMEGHFLNIGKLMEIENDDVGEEEDAEDLEIDGVDAATWEKKNRL